MQFIHMSMYLIFNYGVVMFAKSSNSESDKTAEGKKCKGMLSNDKSTEEAAFAHPSVACSRHGKRSPVPWTPPLAMEDSCCSSLAPQLLSANIRISSAASGCHKPSMSYAFARKICLE